MSNYVERCGGGGGLSETARLEMDSAGLLTLYIGTMSNGQGHETAYSQILNDVLGLPFENIRLVQGDTDQIASGTGTGGSWSIPMGGGAVNLAGGDLIEQAKPLAAKELEAAEADLEFIDGHFRVAGTDIDISLIELAGRGAKISGLARFQPDNHTFPHGCHICEVEVDPETGEIDVIGYTAVHDFGRALNPSLLAGQVHGGVTQGIGQALMEHTVYDDDGQLLTGSYMDYQLPRADDLPDFVFEHRDTPTTRNPLGVKGCGEAGATGAPPAVINAIIDALGHLGVHHLDMPATPERVWNAIQQARQG